VRKEYQEINRLRRSYERQINFRLISTFSKIGTKASDAFIYNGSQGLQTSLASIRTDVGATLEPFYREIILSFAKRTFNNRFAQKAIQDYEGIYKEFMRNIGGTRITEISDTTRQIISRTILENQTAGVDVIAKAINQRMSPKFTRARASTIARTETHTASSFAIQKQAENFEVPSMRKRWVTTTDDRSIGTHLAVNGTEVGIDEDFIVGGKKMKYAGDPRGGASEVINCRCVIVYIEPEDIIVDQEVTEDINTEETQAVDITSVVAVAETGPFRGKTLLQIRQMYNDKLNSDLSSLTRMAVIKNQLPDRIIRDGNKGYYIASDKEISSNLEIKTLTHEYGHHLDYSLMKGKRVEGRGFVAWSEETEAFREAVKKDTKVIGIGEYDGIFFTLNVRYKDQLQKLDDELFQVKENIRKITEGEYKGMMGRYKDKVPKIDGAEYLSDIIDAMAEGRFQDEFGVWGHGRDYYLIGGMKFKEIFANLFTIHNSKQAMEFAKKYFPNTLKVFEEKLSEFK